MKSIIEDLYIALDKIAATRDANAAKQSANDKEINSLYHIIECCTLSAAQMSKVNKRLKAVLVARRELKEEAIMIANILGKTGNELVKCSATDMIGNIERDSTKRTQRYTKESDNTLMAMFPEFKKVKNDNS